MKKTALILFLIFLMSQNLSAQRQASIDSISVLKSSQMRNSAQFNFANSTFRNPAIFFHTFNFSNSEFAIGQDKSKQDEAIVEQIGNGNKGYGFTATTYLAPGQRYRTWGKAQYLNKTIEGQFKNLTSDYYRVYPYITGDTLPARNIDSETYYLSGGYAQDQGKYTWGISVSSRNQQEYRQVDPRPLNRVSDVNIEAGLAWKLPKKYTIGLGVDYNTYKQSQSISFLSEERRKITSALYHFSGLGLSGYASEQSSFSYEAQAYGSTLSLYPMNGNGLFINLRYLYDKLDKNLTGSSSIHTVMSMGEDQYDTQIGWLASTATHYAAIKVSYNHRHRIGSEVMIASLKDLYKVGGAYSYGMFPQYQENIDRLQLQLYYEKNGLVRWFVVPNLTYTKSATGYIHPQRHLNWERMKYSLSSGISFIKGRHLLAINLNVAYDQRLSSEMDISNHLTNLHPNSAAAYEKFLRHSNATELANYRFISTDNKQLGASMRWEWQLLRNKSLFMQPQYQKAWYAQHIGASFYELKIGLVL